MANYFSDPKNALFSPEDDVDDETFLKNSRVNNLYNGWERECEESRQAQLLQRKKELEESAIRSSEKSISVLRESESIGNATAEELLQQREQLERSEQRLDEINATLRYSQRHIQGIRSVFGSLRNYFTRKSELPLPIDKETTSGSSESTADKEMPVKDINKRFPHSSLDSNHPGVRIRDIGDWDKVDSTKGRISAREKPTVNEILDRNLDEMGDALTRLKGLASGLGEEIEEQNELVERITTKTENIDIKIGQQNKEMNKILKK